MEITNDLIQKFFENRCDQQGFDAVMAYFSEHPAEREKLFSIEEWNNIHPDLSLPENDSAMMLSVVREKIFHEQKARPPLRGIFKWTAIAASFIIVAAGIKLLLPGNNVNKGPIAWRRSSVNEQSGTDTVSAWIVRTNRTGRSLKVCLPDSSLVKLENNSSVQYRYAYGAKKRDVYLSGEALFVVKKNSNKPFTVFAGALATTALGTSFTVKASGKVIYVKLYSGKVVVRSTGDLPGWKENVFLLPGEQVSYNKDSMLVAIRRFGHPVINTVHEISKEEQTLVFNNSSLKEVLIKLSDRYHHKIMYNDADITGMNFTGTVAQSDSLVTILRLLATMNGLEVEKKGTIYTLSTIRE